MRKENERATEKGFMQNENNSLVKENFSSVFRHEKSLIARSVIACLIDFSLFCYTLIRFKSIVTILTRPRNNYTLQFTSRMTFDRPSWYINNIGEGKITVACLRVRDRTNRTKKDRKREDDAMIIQINRFYKCYRGPEGCVYLLRVLWAAVVVHVNE